MTPAGCLVAGSGPRRLRGVDQRRPDRTLPEELMVDRADAAPDVEDARVADRVASDQVEQQPRGAVGSVFAIPRQVHRCRLAVEDLEAAGATTVVHQPPKMAS